MVQIGEASSKTLLEIIETIMAKSRSDKRESLEIVDLNEILKQELKFFEADAQLTYKVQKDFQFHDGALPLEVVPVELIQVFQNLVRNALDAMLERRDSVLELKTGILNENVYFSIKDNGPGIDPELQEKVFEPFFTTKTEEQHGRVGNGLGLYTCREMVKSYRGEIQLESEPGQGAKFTVLFPKWTT